MPALDATGFEFEAADDSLQRLAPPSDELRFEGIAFSPSGSMLGIATSDTDTVYLFRRRPDGRFEDAPCQSICGPGSGLNYPHDLSFSAWRGTELLAVAQRAGSIVFYEKERASDAFNSRPVAVIQGTRSRLSHSDGVAFVPPGNDHLAACNLATSSISFYRSASRGSPAFGLEPVFELRHPAIHEPDGLAFSRCGTWLAVANHGKHTVSIFRRRNRLLCALQLRYGPEPATVIEDPGLRFPHSVAFTPETGHLVVTNAGANYLGVYRPQLQGSARRWSQSPVVRKIVGTGAIFEAINARNKMEGGPKGIAIHGNRVAVCSPEHGVNIYSFRESAA